VRPLRPVRFTPCRERRAGRWCGHGLPLPNLRVEHLATGTAPAFWRRRWPRVTGLTSLTLRFAFASCSEVTLFFARPPSLRRFDELLPGSARFPAPPRRPNYAPPLVVTEGRPFWRGVGPAGTSRPLRFWSCAVSKPEKPLWVNCVGRTGRKRPVGLDSARVARVSKSRLRRLSSLLRGLGLTGKHGLRPEGTGEICLPTTAFAVLGRGSRHQLPSTLSPVRPGLSQSCSRQPFQNPPRCDCSIKETW